MGALVLLAAGCAAHPAVPATAPSAPTQQFAPEPALRPVPEAARPPLRDDGDRASLRAAVERSEAWLARQPAGRTLRFGPREIPAVQLATALRELRDFLGTDPTSEALGRHLGARWELWESVAGDSVLVTGYYEPVIAGSRDRTERCRVPVFGPPGMTSAPTRAEIAAGALAGRAPVIGWACDPVDLFFVEVQGSGALRLADGGELRIGYAASNAHPYRSIGRLLIDEGRIPEAAISMQTIRAYLAAHPEEIPRVLHHNESYVFFRVLDGPPEGSLGEPVTPGRSIATDHRIFPPGALAYLATTRPAPEGSSAPPAPFARIVLNQDTGGAIRGPGRVDFFWGRGPEAASLAGRMKQPGRLFFLFPRGSPE
jgi:membrane-bound lytic murein transglycosylase A